MLSTGIEQRHHLAGLWIAGRNIGSFETIAPEAGVRKIVKRRLPSMLHTDDMIRLMRYERGVVGETAVFAAVLSALSNGAAQLFRKCRHTGLSVIEEPPARARISDRMSSSKTS